MHRMCFLAFAASLITAPALRAQPREFTNSLGMKFVWVPPGTFLMGSPNHEEEREPNEFQHKVTLTKGFYLGVTTVTQEQWQAVTGRNPSRFTGAKNLPVEQVSWDDCQEFLEKLGRKEGHAYRLPSEAEWEYACRAGTSTPYCFGDTVSTEQANFNGNSTYGIGKLGVFRLKTTPVASFPPNKWGLYDMHGNVWQWCADTYAAYPHGAVIDPKRPSGAPLRIPDLILQLRSPKYAERQAATKALREIGPPALPALHKMKEDGTDLETQRRAAQLIATINANAEYRVLRGGSFVSPASSLRSAYRFKLEPADRFDLAGFRVARSLAAD
jgi:formylglycine-generating enzyme required for sulfatase activity